jgi:large subunit ribosomal protein L25
MDKIKLNVQEREVKTPNHLRREAKIPATLYGPGEPSVNLQVEEREFVRLPGAAYSHMIELAQGSKSTNAIIRAVQRKASTNKIMNVELYRVRLDRKLTVSVPLKFVGVSDAVVIFGGQFIEAHQEAEIECLPANIPDFLEVDISVIKEIDGFIHFGELKVPDGVEILNPHDEVVAKVVTPREIKEEEEEKPAEAAPAEGAVPTTEQGPPSATTASEPAAKPGKGEPPAKASK